MIPYFSNKILNGVRKKKILSDVRDVSLLLIKPTVGNLWTLSAILLGILLHLVLPSFFPFRENNILIVC